MNTRNWRLKLSLAIQIALFLALKTFAENPDENPLRMPAVGFHQLRVLSPNVLELTLVTTKAAISDTIKQWDFVDSEGTLHLPAATKFLILNGTRTMSPQAVGFKRRVIYAPLQPRDLRIGNYLYLYLTNGISEGQTITVKNPDAKLWPASLSFTTVSAALRFSPAIHVNQTGYQTTFPKKAMVGYFLGSLGELDVPANADFRIVEAHSGKPVFSGKLTSRPDIGFEYSQPPYQRVLEADFSDFKTPGEYRLAVPGLGVSFPFLVNDGLAANFARTYALGMYHQRCGTNNIMPFTRFTHGVCHDAPAEVPTMMTFTNSLRFLTQASSDYTNNPRHTAPRLKDYDSSLYPFVRQGKVDVSGGHHDAGDYSKYTLNSTALLHTLMFAVDSLPGVAELDNLGIPESGDGKSDVLQEAKWEADFLAKMQDDDGGFYFLVYPRDREYESNVTPDQGDPQIVWPKNTAATAAAVAALAQTASSPLFKKLYPEAAQAYLDKAKKGWVFLQKALATFGPDGAYQKMTHYGDDFLHDDELAWAACELYLATGDQSFHQKLLGSFDPGNPATRRWGWWRLYESYGRAIRSYAFAVKTGRVKADQLDQTFFTHCENEIIACADDQLLWGKNSAYGTSFPTETKRFRGGGWYFSMDQAFDLAVACALDHPPRNDPRPKYIEAIIGNLNYEAGCNPVNISYVPGLGWQRPHEIVNQYALNDRRTLPPTGIPVGNLQAGFAWLDNYKQELGALSFPLDGEAQNPYPLYDRWGDSFNVQTESITVNQARALAVSAFLMARTPLKTQRWKFAAANIQIQKSAEKNSPTNEIATLKAVDLDLSPAQVVWEAARQEPAFGSSFSFPAHRPTDWVEAEALMPDGRRIFAVTNF